MKVGASSLAFKREHATVPVTLRPPLVHVRRAVGGMGKVAREWYACPLWRRDLFS